MTTERTKADDEAQIRARIDEWAKAARAKDIDRVMSHYAPDVVAFDAIAALQFKGAEAYKKHWETCCAMCPGPTVFEIHNLDITAKDDVAFCHYLLRCGGTGPDGKEHIGWMRVTVCFRNTEGTCMNTSRLPSTRRAGRRCSTSSRSLSRRPVPRKSPVSWSSKVRTVGLKKGGDHRSGNPRGDHRCVNPRFPQGRTGPAGGAAGGVSANVSNNRQGGPR
jgi:ketosteroid isomerase-like protein